MKATATDSKKANASPAVLCDFDDTVAVENVAELLLNHFGDGQWHELRQQHRQKLITLKEYQELTFAAITADRETMKSLVKERATLRPYFKELWSYCQDNHIPLAIVSHGLDFYVEALLEREGLKQIPFFAVNTYYTSQGIAYRYPYAWEGCKWESGNCKCATLRQYKERGHTVLYAGDGRSDYCPATREADLVFARSSLAQQCRQEGIHFVEFEDFSKVLDALKALINRPRGESQRDRSIF